MSVKLVIDMNLSVEWIVELAQHGWFAVHWSTIGDARADDSVIMAWALANGHVVFTHDLDIWNDVGVNTRGRPKRAASPQPICLAGRHRAACDCGPAPTRRRVGSWGLGRRRCEEISYSGSSTVGRMKRKKTYGFSVVLTALALTDEDCETIYEAGCDDGTIVTRSKVTFIAFDRKAESLEQAIRSASADVRAAGFEIKRVELHALV